MEFFMMSAKLRASKAGTSEALAAQLKQDIERWSRVVKLSGAVID